MAACEIKQKDKWPRAKPNKIRANGIHGNGILAYPALNWMDTHSFNAVVCWRRKTGGSSSSRRQAGLRFS